MYFKYINLALKAQKRGLFLASKKLAVMAERA